MSEPSGFQKPPSGFLLRRAIVAAALDRCDAEKVSNLAKMAEAEARLWREARRLAATIPPGARKQG